MYIAFVVSCNKALPKTIGLSTDLKTLENFVFECRDVSQYKLYSYEYGGTIDSDDEDSYIPELEEDYDELNVYKPPDDRSWFRKFYDFYCCNPQVYIFKFTQDFIDINSILEDLYSES